MAEVPAGGPWVLAGHGRRMAAAMLDVVLFSVTVAASGAAIWRLGLHGSYTAPSAENLEGVGWLLVALLRSWIGYLAANGLMCGVVIWAALTVWLVRRRGTRNGQTIGKQCLGIRAARVDRSETGVVRALVREIILKGLLITLTFALIHEELLGYGNALPAAVLAIAVWYGPALADKQRRGLHDHLCATRVILARDRRRPWALRAPSAPAG